MNSLFRDKTLLITGGTGTFGNAVLRRFLGAGLKEIRILSRDEKKQNEMRNALRAPSVKFYLGDVRAADTIAPAMRDVDFVFHAAALKQVPSCEFFPLEAMRTNTLGAENVMNVALANGVKRAIFLSTDKAVYPINAMGLSKALMEKCMVAKARAYGSSATIFCGTRYGNVMASRGSIIPLLIHQILQKEPLTITDPRMTRFMMSIDDAVDLVVYAFANGAPGDIFVQKAPGATLETLALALQEIFSSKSGVRIIGTRHGEKLHETLLNREEMTHADDLGSYYRVPADVRDLNYACYFQEGEEEVSRTEDFNSENTKRLSLPEMGELLLELSCVQQALQTGKVDL